MEFETLQQSGAEKYERNDIMKDKGSYRESIAVIESGRIP
jgi:hypothetical protein